MILIIIKWKYSWVRFLGIQAGQYVQQLINNNFVLDIKDATQYENKIRQIIGLDHKSLADSLKTNGITYEIFGDLLAEINVKKIEQHHSIATLAKRYMDLNYFDAIQIQDIAKSLNVNANYLSDLFKQEYGISPKQYLTELKIKKAKKLLLTTKNTITIVANSVGFSDSLAFSKIFKKYTTMSPKQYRTKRLK
ncbi:helix-turn-helix domain-containing protein [Lactobacillus isalae]|uniref:helix-turn-helix domain-containing protein n=1 Tax=Lactobacillus isalae TaxID=2993455 RepID=UPI0024A7CEBD|nr:AraC family transcriptional regulator [Lactobacillus isalae]